MSYSPDEQIADIISKAILDGAGLSFKERREVAAAAAKKVLEIAACAPPAERQPVTVDMRPANCRNRLCDEGKRYPKSGCEHCKDGGIRGCPYEPPGQFGARLTSLSWTEENGDFHTVIVAPDGLQKMAETIKTPKEPTPALVALMQGRPSADTVSIADDVLLAMSCDEQHRIAVMLAANVGYELVPEGEIDPSGDGGWHPTHRNLRSGRKCQVIGKAELEFSGSFPPEHGDMLTVFRSENGGLWARPADEFEVSCVEVLADNR